MVRDACGIVSANVTFRVRYVMRGDFGRDPNQMELAS